ncbi:MAG: epoxide hydrolase [Actinomycetota bacterium]|nr:epoxide hydrolase [Actinomycetota bacterium]
MSAGSPERYEVRVADDVVSDLRDRLGRSRWPEQPAEAGWELGSDLAYTRELCEHWRRGYDFARLERLNEWVSARWEGIHFLRAEPAQASREVPVVLLHGWPSGPIEYERVALLIAGSGREAIVPSLPGYAWSEDPGEALNVAGMAARLRALLVGGLGLERFAVAGGDWGAMLAARIAFDDPERVTALHVSTPHTLPAPGDLAEPPLSDQETAWIERAQRWRRRSGHHLAIQSLAPDAISPALSDSPAGLAAYLLGKYRTWSQSGGDLESRFSKDELCDLLTMYWSTGSIASSMRLYWGEARERWRPRPGERIEVPAGVAVYPGDMSGGGEVEPGLSPPRAWSERLLSDLRRWREMPAGGHFAAFEEPKSYAAELYSFLDELEP